MLVSEHRPSHFNLTPKQRAFCHAYVRTGGNAPEAALEAYDCASRGAARVLAHRCLHNPLVQDYLSALMLQSGLVQKAMQYLQEALNAEHKGQPNWKVRCKAADTVFRLAGAYDEDS